jgi:hypothetical protein
MLVLVSVIVFFFAAALESGKLISAGLVVAIVALGLIIAGLIVQDTNLRHAKEKANRDCGDRKALIIKPESQDTVFYQCAGTGTLKAIHY